MRVGLYQLKADVRSKPRAGDFPGAMTDASRALEIEPNSARGLRIGAEARAAVQKKIAAQPVSMPVSLSTSSSSVSIAVETKGAPALVVRSPRPMPPLIPASAQATATSVLLSPLTCEPAALAASVLPDAELKKLKNQYNKTALASMVFRLRQQLSEKTMEVLSLQGKVIELQRQLIAAQSQCISPSADRGGESRPPLGVRAVCRNVCVIIEFL